MIATIIVLIIIVQLIQFNRKHMVKKDRQTLITGMDGINPSNPFRNYKFKRERKVLLMLKKLIITGLCALSAAAVITGCGSDAKPAASSAQSAPAEKKEITVGATAGPHAEVVEAAAKEAEKNGLKVNVKEFSDYITPDQALADGDLDLVVYQHEPFLNNFNKQHNTNLVPIGKTILMRMGIYSNKYKDVKDIPDGATISIPNDSTNEGRGLQLLEKGRPDQAQGRRRHESYSCRRYGKPEASEIQ